MHLVIVSVGTAHRIGTTILRILAYCELPVKIAKADFFNSALDIAKNNSIPLNSGEYDPIRLLHSLNYGSSALGSFREVYYADCATHRTQVGLEIHVVNRLDTFLTRVIIQFPL